MQRRDFLGTVLGGAAGAAAAGPALAEQHDESGETGQQFYELRRYRLESDEDRSMVHAYWRDAAVSAYNRLGVEPVGVFEPVQDSEDAGNVITVLLPYRSLQHMMKVRSKLPGDQDFQQAAEEYLHTPMDNPAYDRIESKLMVAFSAHPQLTVPDLTAQGEDRLFELRTYESHNEHKARRKVEMFNEAEIALFNDLGFPPAVFHGDTVVGDKLPNLTYMLVFEDRQQRDQLWDTFVNSDGWAELSQVERYKNTVSKVHNWFLRPTTYSQL